MVIKFPLMSSTTLPVETRLDATVLISVVRVCPVVTRLVVKVEMSESLLVIWVCNVCPVVIKLVETAFMSVVRV